ncbi:MAG: hypothetical protein M9934_03450 [Thermomicrobiales bacterium]|nr:hypothetical protein [Thermomicrobiales bacterium]
MDPINKAVRNSQANLHRLSVQLPGLWSVAVTTTDAQHRPCPNPFPNARNHPRSLSPTGYNLSIRNPESRRANPHGCHPFQTDLERSRQPERTVGCPPHFLDLCALLGVPTPTEADPSGETYAFEKGASKVGGGDGYADVWYRGHFAIEYKGPKKDLNAAYLQVVKYKDALENPPLLVVCDLDTIRIHTNFTNTARKVYEVNLETLDGFNTERGVSNLVLLANMWKDPEWFRPTITPDSVTVDAAKRFSEIARSLQERGTHPEAAAHFLVQMVFCLFAEDIKLLPENIFSKMIGYTTTIRNSSSNAALSSCKR